MPKKGKKDPEEGDMYIVKCENGHKSEYVPKGGKPEDKIVCPHLVGGKPCKLTCEVIEGPIIANDPVKTPADKTSKKETKKKDTYKVEDRLEGVNDEITKTFNEANKLAIKLGYEPVPTKYYIGYKKEKKQVFRIGLNNNTINVAFNTDKAPKDKRLSNISKNVGDRFVYFIKKLTEKDKDLLMSIINNAKE